MFVDEFHNIAYEGLLLILILSGPPILLSTTIGLMVAVFQAATQIQEQTLSFMLKLFATIFTIIFLGGWLGSQIYQFANNIFSNFYK